MTIIDYTATGTTALKNWEIMTKASDEKLVYEDSSTFWPFHAVFMTHIDNMDWTNIMTYNVAGIGNVNLIDKYGQIEIATIEHERTANNAALAADATDAVAKEKKLKGRAMYTYLFNSVDSKFKKHLTETNSEHKCYGPSSWKIVTEHSIKSDNQNIRRAYCKTHTMTLAEYDYDVNKLISGIEDNNKVLTACGQEDKALTANLFRILKDDPCQEFVDWVLAKQTTWDEGATFDLQNFMRNAKTKYNNYVADGLWKRKKTATDIKKESDVVALTASVARLEALLAQKNADKSGNGGTRNSTGWRNVPPAANESHTKSKNGTTFYWCAHHKFWTKTHTTETCMKGKQIFRITRNRMMTKI